jgi:hypothetical protein
VFKVFGRRAYACKLIRSIEKPGVRSQAIKQKAQYETVVYLAVPALFHRRWQLMLGYIRRISEKMPVQSTQALLIL